MKGRKLLVALIFTMFYLPLGFAQQSLEGNWITVDDKTGDKRAVLHFVVKNGTLNGTVASVFPHPENTNICSACPGQFKDKPIKGLQVVWGLKEVAEGAWEGGRILDAKTGKIYRVKMTLKGDKLYVRGYIGISMLGRTQIWERTV